MAIVTLDQVKAQVGWTDDVGDEDDDLLEGKIAAAQAHVERMLGYVIEERFAAPLSAPADLVEAVLQLAAWWYENRETAGEGTKEVPFGVRDIIAAHRDWSF